MITAQSFASEGTFTRYQMIPSTYGRPLAKTQSSVDAKKGWRRESKERAPRMDSSAGFSSGPRPGRLKSISRSIALRFVRHKRGV